MYLVTNVNRVYKTFCFEIVKRQSVTCVSNKEILSETILRGLLEDWHKIPKNTEKDGDDLHYFISH